MSVVAAMAATAIEQIPVGPQARARGIVARLRVYNAVTGDATGGSAGVYHSLNLSAQNAGAGYYWLDKWSAERTSATSTTLVGQITPGDWEEYKQLVAWNTLAAQNPRFHYTVGTTTLLHPNSLATLTHPIYLGRPIVGGLGSLLWTWSAQEDLKFYHVRAQYTITEKPMAYLYPPALSPI